MEIETWQVLAIAAAVLAVYGLGVGLLGATASPVGLGLLVLFLLAGLFLGRYVSERYFED